MAAEEGWVGIAAVAAHLQVTKDSIYRWVDSKAFQLAGWDGCFASGSRKWTSGSRTVVGALALRELGRIERTLFTLDWLQDIELRRRVQIGLNKGEAKNALARAVFFNRLGELRDRSFENQRYRASGLNLVVAAALHIERDAFHGEWNYKILPQVSVN